MKKYRKLIKELILESELPKDSKFKGYVVYLPESDEFLAGINNDKPDYMICYQWSETPEKAILFTEHSKAIEVINEYDKYEAMLCLLLDIGKQLKVISEDDMIEMMGLVSN